MPLDQTGGARPPSAWTDYLARLKLARRARTRDAPARRRVTQQRLALAEFLLGRIIDGADFLAEVECERQSQAEKAVCLFVTMSLYDFKKLCGHGAEDTDGGEDQQDLEPDDDGEPSLVPASAGHFRFEHLQNDAAADDDRERGDAPAGKVEAMRQRYRQLGGRSRRALIRTGDGKLVGEEKWCGGPISLRLGKVRS